MKLGLGIAPLGTMPLGGYIYNTPPRDIDLHVEHVTTNPATFDILPTRTVTTKVGARTIGIATDGNPATVGTLPQKEMIVKARIDASSP